MTPICDIISYHLHSRAYWLRRTISARFCHFSDSTFYICRHRYIFTVWMKGNLQNFCLSVRCVVLEQKHFAKPRRYFTFLSTLKEILKGNWVKVVVHFSGPKKKLSTADVVQITLLWSILQRALLSIMPATTISIVLAIAGAPFDFAIDSHRRSCECVEQTPLCVKTIEGWQQRTVAWEKLIEE